MSAALVPIPAGPDRRLKLWMVPVRKVRSPGRGNTSKLRALCSRPPPPPSPPWKWHAAHERALNTGPSPSPWASGSFGVHSCSNSSCPTAMSAALADGPQIIGRPSEKKLQYTTMAAKPRHPHPTTRRWPDSESLRMDILHIMLERRNGIPSYRAVVFFPESGLYYQRPAPFAISLAEMQLRTSI